MKRQALIISLLFPLLITSLGASAATVSKLYEAEAPVYGRDNTSKNDAMRQALIDVLVRVSGNQNVSLSPGMPEVLQNPARYVQQFRYGKPNSEFVQMMATRPTQMLWVRFDSSAINQILQNNGMPIWGQSRPSLMVWLVVEDGGARRLVDAQYNGPGRAILEYAGVKRGIPMILPLMDIKDQVLVKVQDVWAGFLDEMIEASKRYNTEAILIGRVSAISGGGWQGRWTIVNGDEPPTGWQNEAEQFNDVILGGVDGGSDLLARRYAQFVDETMQDAVLLQVSDLKSLEDYARVKKYLASLAPVSELLPMRVFNNKIIFRVRFRGSQSSLTRAIKLGNVLVPMVITPVAATADSPEGGNDKNAAQLAYRLIP